AGLSLVCWLRLSSRRVSNATATTLNNAIIGCNAAAVVNCGASMAQPVFFTLCSSSTTQRHSYQSALCQPCSAVSVGNGVSSTHSTGSFTPAGGFVSQTLTAHTFSGFDETLAR